MNIVYQTFNPMDYGFYFAAFLVYVR